MSRSHTLTAALALVCLGLGTSSLAQAPAQQTRPAPQTQAPATQTSTAKRTVQPDDYKLWESLQAPQISKDGHWVSHQIGYTEADGRLSIRNADTPQRWDIPNGMRAVFSDDSMYVAFVVGPGKKVTDAFREAASQPRPPQAPPLRAPEVKGVIKNLTTGEDQVFDSVQRIQFAKGGFALIHIAKNPARKDGGAELLVINLKTGDQLSLGNVASFGLNENETVAALSIETDTDSKGIQLLELSTMGLRNLIWGKDDIVGIRWSKKQDVLAVLSSKDDPTKDGPATKLTLYTNIQKKKPDATVFDSSKLPKETRIAEFGPIVLTEDGSSVRFGLVEWKAKKKPEAKPAEPKADVEIWNSKDIRTVPEQKVQGPGDKRRTLTAVWKVKGDKFTQVSTDKDSPVSLSEDLSRALLIPTPADVLEVVKQIPSGTVTTPVEIRKTLAHNAGADVTCPLVTGIFLRIIAEIAWDELQDGKTDVAPFWRVIDPKSPLAKKLRCGPEFIGQRRATE